MAGRTIRLKDLIKHIGLSRSAIYDRMDEKSPRYAPDFPKSFPLGGTAVGWNEDEVNTWLLNCKNAPKKSTQKATSSAGRIGKKTASSQGQSTGSITRRKKTQGSLAELIMEGGDINSRILDYLNMPSWTPAMGVLIISGVAPEVNCTEIPKNGIGLDGKPLQPASTRFSQALRLLEEWTYWAEDEKKSITELTPGDFLYWCQDNNIETDWLQLCLALCGHKDESKQALVGARFAMLTSK